MKKNLTIVAICILLLLDVAISLFFMNRNKELRYVIDSLSAYPTQKHAISNNLIHNIDNIGKKLIPELELANKDGTYFTIQDILSNHSDYILLVRFSEKHCPSCVSYSVKIMQELQKDDSLSIPVIYIGDYPKHYLFKAQIDNLNLGSFDVYNCSDLIDELDNQGFPYILVVDTNMTIKCCYFPTKNMDKFDKEEIKKFVGVLSYNDPTV